MSNVGGRPIGSWKKKRMTAASYDDILTLTALLVGRTNIDKLRMLSLVTARTHIKRPDLAQIFAPFFFSSNVCTCLT